MPKQEYMKKIKAWEDLTIADDYMFNKVMLDKEICMQALQIILPHLHIVDITYIENQKQVEGKIEYKGIRMDVYVKDNIQRVYDIEMQKVGRKELPKRIRYYHAMLDSHMLEKGESYRNLKDSYIIFVCLEDIFSQGRYKYTFQNICMEDKEILLKDGAIKVFLNARGSEESESQALREFLKFVGGDDIRNPFTCSILKKIEEIKQQEDWRSEYMTMALREIEIRADALEEGELEGLRKGREEGLREGKIEGLREGEKKGKIEGLREGEEKGKREGEKKGLKKSMYLWTKSLLETGIAKEKLVQLLMGIYGLEEEIARAYVEGEEIDWEKQSILDNKILEDTVLEDIVQENDSQVSKDKNKTVE